MKTLNDHLNTARQVKNWLPAFGILEREVRRFFSVPVQTLLGPLCSALIYFGLFGLSLGKIIDQSSRTVSAGVSYATFLIPGIMAMEMVNASVQNPMSSFMVAKWSGTIVDVLMAPLTPFSLWIAYILGACVRAIIVGCSVLIAGMICSHHLLHINVPLLFFSALICVCIFGSLGIVLGIICKSWDQVGMIMSFIIQPLIFFSGVFFSFNFLPHWVQFIKYLNPIFYIVSLFRYAILQTADINIYSAISVVMVFAFLLFGLARWTIQNKLGVHA